MTKTAAVSSHRKARTPLPGAATLLHFRRIGYAILSLQLIGFLTWSTLLWSRYELSFDFSMYHQAWYLIAHGDLNPYSSVAGHPFWQNHFELVMWPLAALYWLWPHGVLLLWVQDCCVVAAETVVFTWICREAATAHKPRDARMLAGLGLLLLAASPWIWQSVSFDFHAETIALLLTVLLLRDLADGRRRAWVWVAPLLMCGDVAGTYLAGAGLGGVLAGRRSRLPGAAMAVLGVLSVLAITKIHGNLGSGGGLRVYSYLAGEAGQPLTVGALVKGIALHPATASRTLWDKRADLLANTVPPGLIGLGFLLVLPLITVVLLAGTLFHGLWFAEPIFQNLPVYILLPLGTVTAIGWVLTRHRRVGLILAGLVAAQAIGWAVVWAPQVPVSWVRVAPAAAAELARVQAEVPAGAQVITSEGIMGRFADRRVLLSKSVPGILRPGAGETWAIITPGQGIEIQKTASALALLAELAGPVHARLVTHVDGVWAFRWDSPGPQAIPVTSGYGPLPAWASPGIAGRSVLTGPSSGWHTVATGARGYVIDGIQWQERLGSYVASVRLSASGPVNVEAWDDTGNVLLARRTVSAAKGVQDFTFPVPVARRYWAPGYGGWGPFRAEFVPPPPGQRIEIRVWSPGGETVNVYRASLTRVG